VPGIFELLLLILVALLPCAVLLAFGLREAEAGEPVEKVIAALALGAAAFGAAIVLELVLPATAADAEAWYRSLAKAGPREELLIVAAALLAAPHPRRMERLSAGITYTIAAGLGFAAAENIAYGVTYGLVAALARGVTAVPAHVLHPALVGVALGRVHRHKVERRAWAGVAAALVAAILAHGLYDLLLMQAGIGRFAVIAFLVLEGAVVMALLGRARQTDEAADLEDLSHVPLFEEAGVGVAALRLMRTRARRTVARAGSRVVKEGSTSDALYVVLKGALVARRGDEELGRIEAGTVFGEIALLTGAPRNADVEAVEDSLLLRVPRSALLEAIACTDDLAEELIEAAYLRGAHDVPEAEDLEEEARRAVLQHEARLMLNEATAKLAAVPLLSAAPRTALATLAQELEEWSAPAGKRLVREGRRGPGLCVVLEGTFDVVRNGETLAVLEPGDWFGEINVLAGVAATADVIARTDGELALLDWPALRNAVGLHPDLGLALLEVLLDRVEHLARSGADLDRRSNLGRFLSMLTATDSLEDVTADSTMANVMDGLATRAHLDLNALKALTGAMAATKDPLWALGPDGLRKLDGALGSEERGLGRLALRDAMARSPETLRVLAMQALRAAAS
jgi:CRP-like cAMP-binding protein/RsiW-degrading membrane proteinase PrsW (M82 family)